MSARLNLHIPEPTTAEAHAHRVVAAADRADAYEAMAAELRAENARLLAATQAFVAWLDGDERGPIYPLGTDRKAPGGEAIWREWWDEQHRLCRAATELGRAAIARAEALGKVR